MRFEPLQHRLRTALKLEVTVPPRCGAVYPLELLVGKGDIVEYRLYVIRCCQDVVVNLAEKGGHVDVLRASFKTAECG